jgi:FtsH-binding integral membrane protein
VSIYQAAFAALLERPMASNDPRFSIGSFTDARAGAPAIDQGLRAFMLAVYNHMTIGVALTGLVALGTYMASAIEVNGHSISAR